MVQILFTYSQSMNKILRWYFLSNFRISNFTMQKHICLCTHFARFEMFIKACSNFFIVYLNVVMTKCWLYTTLQKEHLQERYYITLRFWYYVLCIMIFLSFEQPTLWTLTLVCGYSLRWWLTVLFSWTPGPVFTKLFRVRIKIRLKLKNLILWTFLKPTIII